MKGTTGMRVTWAKWRVWAAIGALLIATSPAHAFYWPNWPGSRTRTEPTLIGPPNQHMPGNPPSLPPVQPPPTQPPADTPGPGDIPVPPIPVGPPQQTPEPSTMLIGLVGLGTLAAARRWWKRG